MRLGVEPDTRPRAPRPGIHELAGAARVMAAVMLMWACACSAPSPAATHHADAPEPNEPPRTEYAADPIIESDADLETRAQRLGIQPFFLELSEAALERTRHRVRYDSSYVGIGYPCGDVPADRGVCSDVAVRAYRALGIDLQRLVHEDMLADFHRYPDNWGARRADPNIDHRRVLNLMVFLERRAAALPVTDNPADYLPGDLVAWDLKNRGGKGLPHIGIVTHLKSEDGQRFLIVHNIGAGPRLEDVLFNWQILGRYRYDAAEAAERVHCPPVAAADD